MKVGNVLLLFVFLTALSGCNSTSVSYKEIHHGLYWHNGPYQTQSAYPTGVKDFLKKRNIKWGDSYSDVSGKIGGFNSDISSAFKYDVHLFPELKVLNIIRDKTSEFSNERFEEADIFSNGTMYFYNDKLYEITFTYSRHNSVFGTLAHSNIALQISKDDPALHGIYHVYEYMKLLLKEKYGLYEEKNYWKIDKQKQQFIKADEEIGRSYFQNTGKNFVETVWKRGETEIRLLYLAYGYGTVKLHYWNPKLRRVVANLEQKRKYEQVNKHF